MTSRCKAGNVATGCGSRSCWLGDSLFPEETLFLEETRAMIDRRSARNTLLRLLDSLEDLKHTPRRGPVKSAIVRAAHLMAKEGKFNKQTANDN